MELFNTEIPCRKKLREALSRLSKAQENVVKSIIDISNKYRRKKQEKDIRKCSEEREVIKNTHGSWNPLARRSY